MARSLRGSVAARPFADVYAATSFASAGAFAGTYVGDYPSPLGNILPYVCAVVMIFGFSWGAFRLIRPRR